MKIAYVVPYVPNLIRTRPYNLITRLASLGHEVEVFTLGSNGQEWMDARSLKARCRAVHYSPQPLWRSMWNSAVAVPSRQPLQTVYSWQNGLARSLVECVSREKFDIVHVEHLRGSRYGLFIKGRFPAVPVVWDSVDCISHLFQQAANQGDGFFARSVTRFELSRTRQAEGNLVCSFDRVLVTSSTDRNALLDLVPAGRSPSPISVLPNGVDLDYFHPNPAVRRDEDTILFTGKMSYHANISMALYLLTQIMPRIWERRPTTRVMIVGKDPPSDIKERTKDPRVTVTGTVNDIRPFLWRATVSAVPLLYGAGIQNKILEAMATGTPVVTTDRALPALQAIAGRDLLASNDPEEFSRAVLRLIEDGDLRREIGDGGAAYARAFHDWNCVASELVDIYREALTAIRDPS
jgi:glycosyltransferase involved in cell wall biosynthesis